MIQMKNCSFDIITGSLKIFSKLKYYIPPHFLIAKEIIYGICRFLFFFFLQNRSLESERKDDYGTIEDDIGRTELQRQAEEKKKQYVYYTVKPVLRGHLWGKEKMAL